jgi:hypothetical protein
LERNIEIAERWIAGNVVEKSHSSKTYLKQSDDRVENLTALEDARPKIIDFEELGQ